MDAKRSVRTFNDGSPLLFISWLAVILFLTATILIPLLRVFAEPDAQSLHTVMTNPQYGRVIANTARICLCSTLLSVLTGYLYAYAVVFARIPGRRFFAVLPVLHLITPPFVGGLAFILLVGRQGFITKTLLGLDISLYGFWGLLLAQVLCFFPIAYMICAQTLQGINPHLIQAARSMGAGNWTVFRTVILPLSAPGILTSCLFIAVSVLSDFGNPLIVAGRFKVLAVEIYTQLTGWLNAGTSAILGIILLVPACILFALQNYVTRKHSVKTATIGGKISPREDSPVSLPARILLTLFCLFIALCVLAQFIAIVAGSFQKLWGIQTQFTMEHFKSLQRYSKELKNSLFFAFTAAIMSALIATVTSFLVHRTNVPFRKTIDTVIQLPAAVPGSLFGLAINLAAGTIHLRNARLLVLTAMIIGFMPFSYRIITSTMGQIRSSLDDAGRSLGQHTMGVLATILAPLSASGIFSGAVYNFARGIGTVSAVIFLVSFNTPLASIRILNLAEQGDWGKACALALILTILTFAVVLIGNGIQRMVSHAK
ncbi:MAG: iron ABC transporter permease [Treponemataceae bacterium]|nr:iron ABC transporter permease [Treponemataceae bacterium]